MHVHAYAHFQPPAGNKEAWYKSAPYSNLRRKFEQAKEAAAIKNGGWGELPQVCLCVDVSARFILRLQ
jgi:hypothetical protein